MRARSVHVSFLEEPRNALSNRYSSLHMILFSSIRCSLLVVENPQAQVREVSVSETENVEVLNGALFMTQNAADRVSRLRSRTVVSPGCSHP